MTLGKNRYWTSFLRAFVSCLVLAWLQWPTGPTVTFEFHNTTLLWSGIKLWVFIPLENTSSFEFYLLLLQFTDAAQNVEARLLIQCKRVWWTPNSVDVSHPTDEKISLCSQVYNCTQLMTVQLNNNLYKICNNNFTLMKHFQITHNLQGIFSSCI